MLPTDLSTFFLIAAGFLAVFAAAVLFWVLQLAKYCKASVDWVQNQNSRSVGLRRMADLEATCTELLDSYNALLTSHKKLRSRIGMREGRAKRKNGIDSSPGATDSEKAAYKAELRNDLRQRGLLR